MIAGHIEDLIHAAKEMKKQPGLDKEAINRGISALSNALYAFKHVEMSASTISRLERQEMDANGQIVASGNHGTAYDSVAGKVHYGVDMGCICHPGARNRSCTAAVHNV